MLARLNTYQNFRLRRHLSPSWHSRTFHLFILFNGSLTFVTRASESSRMSTVRDNTNMPSHFGAVEALGAHNLLEFQVRQLQYPDYSGTYIVIIQN
jgi:hypothetical protein